MTAQDYENQYKACKYQMNECERQMKKIQKELSEAEEAYENAMKYKRNFYGFMDKSNTVNRNFMQATSLKSMISFANNITALLTGKEFHKAENNVQEIITCIKREIIKLEDNYAYYKQRYYALGQKADSILGEYEGFLENEEKQVK